MGTFKRPRLTTKQQINAVQRDYSFGILKVTSFNEFEWEGYLKSSPIGDKYLLKIVYKKKESPKVYVLEPKILELPIGATKLEHVYNHTEQRLCLYYPKTNEWDESFTITSTIFLWAIEWLYHYEIWLITGEWKGGGVHRTSNKK